MERGLLRAADAEQEDPERDPLRCATCGLEVADQDASFSIGAARPVGTFTNPAGLVFEVLAVAGARNLVVEGPPTPASSWFPGYAWSIAYCAGCGAHLGWWFDAVGDRLPSSFVGFVLPRVC